MFVEEVGEIFLHKNIPAIVKKMIFWHKSIYFPFSVETITVQSTANSWSEKINYRWYPAAMHLFSLSLYLQWKLLKDFQLNSIGSSAPGQGFTTAWLFLPLLMFQNSVHGAPWHLTRATSETSVWQKSTNTLWSHFHSITIQACLATTFCNERRNSATTQVSNLLLCYIFLICQPHLRVEIYRVFFLWAQWKKNNCMYKCWISTYILHIVGLSLIEEFSALIRARITFLSSN